MTKILVTGVAGLLGSNFAKFLINETSDEVIGVDDLSCGMLSNLPRKGMKFYKRTLGQGFLDTIVREHQPEIIYHFAAYAAECLSPFVRKFNYINNLLGTTEIVNACINFDVRQLVFTSSMAVYGKGLAPFHEDQVCKPIDPYGVAKLACEQDIQIAGEQHGLNWCILRPHNVFGVGQSLTQKYRNVFGIWMERHMRGLPIQIYGNGEQLRAFTCIDDILEPLYEAKRYNKETINLGGSKPISINEAASIFSDAIRSKIEIEYCEGRHEVFEAWCTVEKSQKLLGYKDITSLQDGLHEMYEWALNTIHSPGLLPLIEVKKGLPEYWR